MTEILIIFLLVLCWAWFIIRQYNKPELTKSKYKITITGLGNSKYNGFGI